MRIFESSKNGPAEPPGPGIDTLAAELRRARRLLGHPNSSYQQKEDLLASLVISEAESGALARDNEVYRAFSRRFGRGLKENDLIYRGMRLSHQAFNDILLGGMRGLGSAPKPGQLSFARSPGGAIPYALNPHGSIAGGHLGPGICALYAIRPPQSATDRGNGELLVRSVSSGAIEAIWVYDPRQRALAPFAELVLERLDPPKEMRSPHEDAWEGTKASRAGPV